ncbi:MAG: PAS domain S-box protein [Prolixibacteraceae bacterium]
MHDKTSPQNTLSGTTVSESLIARGNLLRQKVDQILEESLSTDQMTPQDIRIIGLLKEMSDYQVILEKENLESGLLKKDNNLTSISQRTLLNNDPSDFPDFSRAEMGEAIKETTGKLSTANQQLEERAEQRMHEILDLSNFQRAILDGAGVAIISTNADGIIQVFNPAAEQMLGYQAEEVIGIHTPVLFHQKSELEQKAVELQELTGNQVIAKFEIFPTLIGLINSSTSEWIYVRKDGRQFPVMLTVSSFRDEEGTIKGYIGVAMNISKEKLVLESLRESQERFQKLFYDHSAVMLLVDPSTGNIVDANRAAVLFYGYNFHSVPALKISDINTHTNEMIKSEMKRAIGQDKNYFEFEHRLATGDVRQVEVHSTPIEVGGKKLLFSIIHDITERKCIERALSWNEAFLKKMTESSPLAFLVVDNRTDEILYINHQFCEIWGINHLEERIRNHELKNNDIIPDCLPVLKDVPAFAESCKPLQYMDNRETIEDEIPFMDGRIIRRFSTQIRDVTDQYHGRLYIFEDITTRKTIEQLLILQRDLTAQLSATSNLHEALSIMMDAVFQISGVDMGGIYLFNDQGTELSLFAHRGLSEKFLKEKSFYGADSPNVKIVLQGKPIYAQMPETTMPELIKDADQKVLSLAFIPFKHEDKVIGVINLASMTSTRFYSDMQISIESLAAQIGGTISRIYAENALISSQQNFQMLFETIDDFLFILDIDANIIQANSIVKKRLGYTTAELAGLNVLTVHPPDRREEAGYIVGEMLAGRAAYCPVPLYAKDGTLIPVETRVILGKWDDKDVLFGISRDVSERQKGEAALRESEARWNFALEGSGDGVWDWNIKANEVFYSKQWKAMLGYSNEEISMNLDEWSSRVHPDDLPQVSNDLNRHFNGETEIYSNEHRALCKDGTYKWILDRGKVVSRFPDGKPLRVIGTHSDITSAKQIEETLRLTVTREKELNELKSRFVSMASHEFRTPLATILMTGDSLLAYWKRMDEEQINTKLGNIKDQVQHLTKIVTDVMQVSKIQEGKLSFSPQDVDLVELCRKIVKDFNTDRHLKTKIKFESEFDCLVISLDNTLMVHVLNNMISNAIKYSEPNPIVEVNLWSAEDEILLSIKDNGIGIPEADQKYLFQPFYRAGNVKKIHGNGLGLNIVRESVRLHGGEIKFESIQGVGTTFVVHLPKQIMN